MPNTAKELQRLQTRRAVGPLVLSALVPGSVQFTAGNRKVGRIALKVWLGVLAVVGLVALLAWVAPGIVAGVFLTPWVTVLVKILVWLLFFGWAGLLIDSWRLADPKSLERGHRLFMTIAVLVLVLLTGGATAFATNALTAAGNVGFVLPGGGDKELNDGRYNILLLGVDAANDRIGVRPDSINVASVDAETGRTVLFGLPRNMQGVPFPEDSPMHDVYPEGFRCADNECMLNAVWSAGEENAELYDDDANAGLEATKDAVGETLGLDLNYYALVDMHGFSSIVDAMGGITMDVRKAIPIGGGSSKISGYIEPGEDVHLDGHHALWFARSREGSSDYERMQRQKCVVSAMVNQMDPTTVATRFVELSEAGKDLLKTDVGRGEIVDLAALALKTRDTELASVNFTPPLVPDTADPDFGVIRRTVEEYIDAAEEADKLAAKAAKASTTPSPSASAEQQSPEPAPSPVVPDSEMIDAKSDDEPTNAPVTPKDEGDVEAYTDENVNDDLEAVCSAG